MTNRIAIILGILILALVATDGVLYHWELTIHAGRQLMLLTEYIAFWR